MDEGQNTVCKNDSVSSQTDTMEKAYFLVPDTVCPHLEKRPPGRIALRRRGIILLKQSAAGGESCKAGFFFISQESALQDSFLIHLR